VNGTQATRPTTGGTDPVNPETAPLTISPNPLSQADEIQALKARLECYKKDGIPLATMHELPVLFSDQETINHIKAATVPSKDDGKKLTLPDVVPGFKASSLDISESLSSSRTTYVICSNILVSHFSPS
jgi:hypothetical protein